MSRRARGVFAVVLVGVLAVGALIGRRHHQAAPAAIGHVVPSRFLTSLARTIDASHALAPLPGALLIADRGNDRMLLVDVHKHVIWHFPTASDLARGIHLNFNDDGFVEPGGTAIVSNEEEAHTIVSVNIRTHARVHLYGTPGVRGSGPNQLDTPDDAYVLPDGTLTVADAYNCRILFIRAHRIVRQIGRTRVCVHNPPATLGAVNGDTPLPDGGVLISEIQGSWIDDIARNGKLRWAVQAPVRYPSDPQPLPGGRILLADYSNPGAALVIDRRGHVLWRYRPLSGNGKLDHPSLAMMLPNGDVAVNDDYRHRVVIIDPRSNRIVWQYGVTDSPGTGFDRLRTPDGMDFVPLSGNNVPLWSSVHHPPSLSP